MDHDAEQSTALSVQGIALITLILAAASPAVSAEWFLDTGVEYTFDDNLPRAKIGVDIESDHMVELDASAGWYQQLTDKLGATLSADISAEQFARFDDLSNMSYDLSASLNQKLGLGVNVPRVRLAGFFGYHNFRHDPRDGWHYGFSGSVSKRVTERLDLTLAADYEKRWSDDVFTIPIVLQRFGQRGDAWDTEAYGVSLTGTLSITERLSAYASYKRRDGDVVSSTQRDFVAIVVSDATAFDRVFGDDKVAYRLEANTDIFSFGLSWAIGGHASVGAGYQRIEADGRGPNDYSNDIASINLLYVY